MLDLSVSVVLMSTVTIYHVFCALHPHLEHLITRKGAIWYCTNLSLSLKFLQVQLFFFHLQSLHMKTSQLQQVSFANPSQASLLEHCFDGWTMDFVGSMKSTQKNSVRRHVSVKSYIAGFLSKEPQMSGHPWPSVSLISLACFSKHKYIEVDVSYKMN